MVSKAREDLPEPDSPVSTDDQTPFAADVASAAAQLLQTPPETGPEMPALREAIDRLCDAVGAG